MPARFANRLRPGLANGAFSKMDSSMIKVCSPVAYVDRMSCCLKCELCGSIIKQGRKQRGCMLLEDFSSGLDGSLRLARESKRTISGSVQSAREPDVFRCKGVGSMPTLQEDGLDPKASIVSSLEAACVFKGTEKFAAVVIS